MFRKWVIVSAAAAFGLIGAASLSNAAPQTLNGVDASGTVAAGTTWFPGAGSSTGLTLNITGTSGFLLKEIPVTGGSTGPGPGVPLPASIWTGLSGLAGLALLGAAKNAKKRLA